ncbi:MAG TPA: GNAT family N-acetyltransferase [Actinomycetes bacterium]|nr:GNAT family N-acetyltransferase [Actinomycetes bacterium]
MPAVVRCCPVVSPSAAHPVRTKTTRSHQLGKHPRTVRSGAGKADGMEVRQARAADWETLRELRLRALADAPDAFASTLQQETAFPEQVWRQRAKGGAASVNFIAYEGGAGIGMAAIFAVANTPGRMHLVGMWVDPQHRRRGVAQALVERAVRWAEERQAREVLLWVADPNVPARMLYERVGFQPTGERQPLPSNPVLTESLLRLSLNRSISGL